MTSIIQYNYVGGAVALSAPIALVADIYLGCYKVIQYSMRLLWIAVIASNTIIALQYYVVNNAATSSILTVFTTIGVAATAGIFVNSLQFGLTSSQIIHHLKLPPISAGILGFPC